MKKYMLVCLLLLMLFTINSCTTDDSESVQNVVERQLLVGTWEMDKIVVDGVEQDYRGGVVTIRNEACGRDYFELNNNDTYKYYSFDRRNECSLRLVSQGTFQVYDDETSGAKIIAFIAGDLDGYVYAEFQLLEVDRQRLKIASRDEGFNGHTYVLKRWLR